MDVAADGVCDFVDEAEGDLEEEAEAAAGVREVEARIFDGRAGPLHVDKVVGVEIYDVEVFLGHVAVIRVGVVVDIIFFSCNPEADTRGEVS